MFLVYQSFIVIWLKKSKKRVNLIIYKIIDLNQILSYLILRVFWIN